MLDQIIWAYLLSNAYGPKEEAEPSKPPKTSEPLVWWDWLVAPALLAACFVFVEYVCPLIAALFAGG